MVALAAGDFRPAQTAGAHHLDAAGAHSHGAAHAVLHGAAEGNPLLQLLGNVLCHQLCVGIGGLDLHDVQGNRLAQLLFQLQAQALNLRAALPMTTPGRAQCR